MSRWPSHLLATGVLVWDGGGRLLMVKTHNRDALILPGGIVEADESPAAAGQREVMEEVGLDVGLGRLLVVQHLLGEGEIPSSVQFVFDSEPFVGTPALALQADEIEVAVWVHPEEAVASHGVRGRKRLRAALLARSAGSTAFLDSTEV